MRILAKDLHAILYYNGAVSLTFDCGLEIKEELQQLLDGDYVISIDNPKKRSLSQNALLWELIGQIGMKENGNRTGDTDIYVNILKMAGVKVIPITIAKDEYERFCKTSDFRAVSIVHEQPNSTGRPFVTCYCYVGSSKMDSAEMSAVIDKAIEYANQVGVDTDLFERRFRECR